MNLRPSGLGHSIYQGDHIIEVKGKRIPQTVDLNQLGSFCCQLPRLSRVAHFSPEVAPNDRRQWTHLECGYIGCKWGIVL